MTDDELIRRYARIYEVDEDLIRAWWGILTPQVQRIVERTTTKNRTPAPVEDARAYEAAMTLLIETVIAATTQEEETA